MAGIVFGKHTEWTATRDIEQTDVTGIPGSSQVRCRVRYQRSSNYKKRKVAIESKNASAHLTGDANLQYCCEVSWPT